MVKSPVLKNFIRENIGFNYFNEFSSQLNLTIVRKHFSLIDWNFECKVFFKIEIPNNNDLIEKRF